MAIFVILALAVSGCASDHTSYKVGNHVYEDVKPVPARSRTVIGQAPAAGRAERGE